MDGRRQDHADLEEVKIPDDILIGGRAEFQRFLAEYCETAEQREVLKLKRRRRKSAIYAREHRARRAAARRVNEPISPTHEDHNSAGANDADRLTSDVAMTHFDRPSDMLIPQISNGQATQVQTENRLLRTFLRRLNYDPDTVLSFMSAADQDTISEGDAASMQATCPTQAHVMLPLPLLPSQVNDLQTAPFHRPVLQQAYASAYNNVLPQPLTPHFDPNRNAFDQNVGMLRPYSTPHQNGFGFVTATQADLSPHTNHAWQAAAAMPPPPSQPVDQFACSLQLHAGIVYHSASFSTA
eukprot:TRINITY_DN10201_c0_g1_i1.p1 TRINITY_DN10201_c0_g1~~TRINITY_DN10201_c0_g1_i1.p1  ORF type:complete len:297 (+),score=41.94 TRINITY_DN10201_c0_g1_i1:255-1145(+)